MRRGSHPSQACHRAHIQPNHIAQAQFAPQLLHLLVSLNHLQANPASPGLAFEFSAH
jgi:hypothetical protein